MDTSNKNLLHLKSGVIYKSALDVNNFLQKLFFKENKSFTIMSHVM